MVVKLDVGGTRWLEGYAWRNYWKVRHIYDEVTDLVQDGHMCWGIVVNKYTDVGDLTQDGRLMSLFKMTFVNHIRWVASMDKDKEYNKLKVRMDDLVHPGEHVSLEQWYAFLDRICLRNGQSGDLFSDSSVQRTIIEASDPIRSVLQFLVSDHGIDVMRRPFRRRLDGSRETVNARIRRYIGKGENLDLLGMTKQYLLEATH